jgi:hypothetical protein
MGAGNPMVARVQSRSRQRSVKWAFGSAAMKGCVDKLRAMLRRDGPGYILEKSTLTCTHFIVPPMTANCCSDSLRTWVKY